MTPVEIKSVDHSDFDRWLSLWRGYQGFYAVDIPEAATAKTWARFLDPGEPVHAAIAMSGGYACGLVHWIYHRSTWTVADYCYLQDLFVSHGSRRSGLGRGLIEHVVADSKRRGAPRVYWLTHKSNQNAIRFYRRVAERSGFVHYLKRLA